ncbi:cytosine permease [Salmonella enterica subsp. arizonae]|uniref:Cytosine permease n=1 Tax=Salmonella enterica subsp. arizonae TaxID=59203 RepID=A0A379T4I9_SALER|nr:cytosine permease [Salmonella enterica subsp. arizonae]
MSQDNNYSQGPVPQAARKGVIPLTFVMLGLTFFSASMWTGGTLGTGLSYQDFFLAVLFGNLLLGIYTAFLGYIGAKNWTLNPTFLLVTPLALKVHGFPRCYWAVLKWAGLALA